VRAAQGAGAQVGQGHHAGGSFHRAKLTRGEAAASQRDELAVRSSAEPVFGQGRGVDDRSAAAVIEPGQITEPDRLQLRGAQSPPLVHRRAAGTGVDPAAPR
jgi:hypothetical protein